MIIDAKGLILGRMAAFAAEQALLGQDIAIINCDKAVISGTKNQVVEKYKQKRSRGEPSHGPHVPRRSDLMVKRTIRGMLPYKTPRGAEAFKKIKCYLGEPEDVKGEAVIIKKAKAEKLPNLKYVEVGEISKIMGAKQ